MEQNAIHTCLLPLSCKALLKRCLEKQSERPAVSCEFCGRNYLKGRASGIPARTGGRGQRDGLLFSRCDVVERVSGRRRDESGRTGIFLSR